MGLKMLQIIFDNSTAIFKPGDVVSGRVLIVTNNSFKLRRIKFKFKGEAVVTWTEQELRTNSKNETEYYSVNYNAQEEYLNYKTILAGDGLDEFLLEGEHVYPFCIPLPLELPSTFKDEFGYVQYKAKVIIHTPRGKKMKESLFEVNTPINLNDYPNLAEPRIKEEHPKIVSCCCCIAEPMTLIVGVPFTGFVPGQSIPVTIELDNNSNEDIDLIRIQLNRILKFKACYPYSNTKSKIFKVVNICLNGVKKHTSKTRTNQIKIPNNLTIPNLNYCGIIIDLYFLNIEVCINGEYLNAVTSINLKLGNFPLTKTKEATKFNYSFQPLNQSFFSNELFTTNYLLPIVLIDSMPIPGYAHPVAPPIQHYSLSSVSSCPNLEKMITFTQNNTLNSISSYPDISNPN